MRSGARFGRFSLMNRPLLAPNLAAAPIGSGVPSPCVSVCTMSPQTGLCEGCLRTIDEIAHWGLYTEDEKRAVWAQLQVRRGQPVERGAR